MRNMNDLYKPQSWHHAKMVSRNNKMLNSPSGAVARHAVATCRAVDMNQVSSPFEHPKAPEPAALEMLRIRPETVTAPSKNGSPRWTAKSAHHCRHRCPGIFKDIRR